MLRIQKVDALEPRPFTVLGWRVEDIAATIRDLTSHGVTFERYPFIEQDDEAVWHAPVDYQNGQSQKMLLDVYGLSGKLVSVRSFDIDANDLYPERTPPHAVIDRVVETARQCVEEDGAETLIPGCTLAGSVLTHDAAGATQAAGAPIIDRMLAGFKLAEMWADLARAGLPPASRRGFFEQPPAEEYEQLRRYIGKDATPLTSDRRSVVHG